MAARLDQIVASTRAAAEALRPRRAELETQAWACPAPPDFGPALRRQTVALVAEVKRRSPSSGVINAQLEPAARAEAYAEAGAAAISVLTDNPFFGGSLEDLRQVAEAVRVPVLRKDFILQEEQLLEARGAGASAVLLIVRILGPSRLSELLRAARDLDLAALVEVHGRDEMQTALAADAGIIGVNSRDLDSFTIDVNAALALIAGVPADRIAVAESGLASAADVARAADAGADAVLIGTALSASARPGKLAAELAGVARRGR